LQPNRGAKAELNRRSRVCEVPTGTGVRVAGNLKVRIGVCCGSGDPADRAPDFLGITPEGSIQSPAAQRIQVLKCNQGLRVNAVTKVQPCKITERLLSGRDHLVRGLVA
jgi:hypothetical protein